MPKTSIEIHSSEMSNEMEREALQVALLAVNIYEKGNDIAKYMMEEFNRRHGNYWQCIIGDCAYSVTFKQNSYISFSVDDKKIVLFRTP